jgi:hypothetical protein
MRIKNFLSTPWGISIGTTVFGVLFTLFVDYIRSKPGLSTLKMIVSSVCTFFVSILNYKLKLWWVIIAIVVTLITFYLILRISEGKVDSPTYTKYKSDTFKVWKWSWEWKQSSYDKRWQVSNLTAYCPKCGHSLLQSYDLLYGYSFQCPMCNFYSRDETEEHPVKIERIIIDRVQRIN